MNPRVARLSPYEVANLQKLADEIVLHGFNRNLEQSDLPGTFTAVQWPDYLRAASEGEGKTEARTSCVSHLAALRNDRQLSSADRICAMALTHLLGLSQDKLRMYSLGLDKRVSAENIGSIARNFHEIAQAEFESSGKGMLR